MIAVAETHPKPEPLTEAELAAIADRAAKATAGPWLIELCDRYDADEEERIAAIYTESSGKRRKDIVICDSGVYPPHGDDAAFIRASREDVPRLVETIRVRDAEIERLRAAIDAAIALGNENLSKTQQLADRIEGLRSPALREDVLYLIRFAEIATSAAFKPWTMYRRREVSPRAELDGLIGTLSDDGSAEHIRERIRRVYDAFMSKGGS